MTTSSDAVENVLATIRSIVPGNPRVALERLQEIREELDDMIDAAHDAVAQADYDATVESMGRQPK